MASFEVTIPDELTPGIVATAYAEGKQPEEVVSEYAQALANKICQDLKVGPYFIGSIPPQFNQDGTPYGLPEPDPEVEDTDPGEA